MSQQLLPPNVCSGSVRNRFLGSGGGEDAQISVSGDFGYISDGLSSFGQQMCDHYLPFDLTLFMKRA